MYLTVEKRWTFWFDTDNIDITNFDIGIYRYWFLLDISDTNWFLLDILDTTKGH